MRYFMDRDDSGHWYLVEQQHRADWDVWSNLDEEDPVGWATPRYATRLSGAPNTVTFSAPVEG